MMTRWYLRHRKKLVLTLAALPVFQMAGSCDLLALSSDIGSSIATQFISAGFEVFVSSATQVLLQSFPSADVLQTLFGTNRQPFFTG